MNINNISRILGCIIIFVLLIACVFAIYDSKHSKNFKIGIYFCLAFACLINILSLLLTIGVIHV